MEQRVQEYFQQQISFATAPEIGAGLVAALDDSNGVRWRTGVWFVPGDSGTRLVDAGALYVRQIGSSKAGSLRLYDEILKEPEETSGAREDLRARVERYFEKVLDAMHGSAGTRALRNLWDKAYELERLLEANATILTEKEENLSSWIDKAREELRSRAADLGVEVDRSGSATVEEHAKLVQALDALRAAAEQRRPEALKQALEDVSRYRKAALARRRFRSV